MSIGDAKAFLLPSALSAFSVVAGCSKSHDAAAEAPPPANVTPIADAGHFAVDHPEQFPLAAAVVCASAPELVVTGVVDSGVARNVPVISSASGRVVGI